MRRRSCQLAGLPADLRPGADRVSRPNAICQNVKSYQKSEAEKEHFTLRNTL
jgi:hypothetical protein